MSGVTTKLVISGSSDLIPASVGWSPVVDAPLAAS